ncbi:hypothetical protein HW555_002778 [Spodoptera exigua]|uniref:Uncharacterized protein n=1 Tax=Spodoptera exigua TaxID=7107 RepID=A0A835GQ24_SPOEX|nr:hypothetical protein HW555_002778 [Spodoptera exigua]
MTWDITLDFEYVVTKKPPPRICFGSAQERVALPLKGPCLSPFMRRMAIETREDVGPTTYEIKRDAFSDVTNRPPPRAPRPKAPIKQNCAPFNSTSKRKGIFSPSYNPAPCDYCPEYIKRQMKFAYSFSGKKTLKCAVQIKCVPYNLDECGYCGCSCSQQGDYWQYENRIFLCRKHYNRLFKHCLSKFQGAKLAEFKSVRDCFFAHAHNSCKAALKIMKSEEIVKKLRKEAYLDLFFPQRRFCNN